MTDYQPISPVYLARAFDPQTQTQEDYDNSVSLNESYLNQNLNTLNQQLQDLQDQIKKMRTN